MSVTSSISAASAEPSLLYVNTDTVGTGANTDETTLASYTLPANTLDVDGDYIEVNISGKCSSTTNPATLKLYFESAILTVSIGSTAGQAWTIKAKVYRTGTATQKYEIEYAEPPFGIANFGSFSSALEIGTAAEDLTSGLLIKVTAQNAITSANEIVKETFTVSHKKK